MSEPPTTNNHKEATDRVIAEAKDWAHLCALRALRSKGWTKKRAAEELKVTPSFVHHILNKEAVTLPSLLLLLSAVGGVTVTRSGNKLTFEFEGDEQE